MGFFRAHGRRFLCLPRFLAAVMQAAAPKTRFRLVTPDPEPTVALLATSTRADLSLSIYGGTKIVPSPGADVFPAAFPVHGRSDSLNPGTGALSPLAEQNSRNHQG